MMYVDSGTKIKILIYLKFQVWNYKQRKCIFTLLGHLDYIRYS
jgi:hypothetical protein